MSLLDDLKDVAKASGNTVRCSLCLTLRVLSKEEKVALLNSINDSGVTAISIVRVLKIHGHHVTDQSIWKHRKKECATSASFE